METLRILYKIGDNMIFKRTVILSLLSLISINLYAEVFVNPSFGRTSIGYSTRQIERNFICSALTGRWSVAQGYKVGEKYGRLINNNSQLQPFQFFETELRVSTSGTFNLKQNFSAKIFTEIECVDSQMQADLDSIR